MFIFLKYIFFFSRNPRTVLSPRLLLSLHLPNAVNVSINQCFFKITMKYLNFLNNFRLDVAQSFHIKKKAS